MAAFADYKVADISLAPWGRIEIGIVQTGLICAMQACMGGFGNRALLPMRRQHRRHHLHQYPLDGRYRHHHDSRRQHERV